MGSEGRLRKLPTNGEVCCIKYIIFRISDITSFGSMYTFQVQFLNCPVHNLSSQTLPTLLRLQFIPQMEYEYKTVYQPAVHGELGFSVVHNQAPLGIIISVCVRLLGKKILKN